MLPRVSLRAIRFEVFMALAVKESVLLDVSESPPKFKIFNFVKRFDCKFNPPKILKRNFVSVDTGQKSLAYRVMKRKFERQ